MSRKNTDDILKTFELIDDRYILEADDRQVLKSLRGDSRTQLTGKAAFHSGNSVSRRRPKKRFVPVLAAAAVCMFAAVVIAAVTGNLQSVFPDSFRTTESQELISDSVPVVIVSGQEHIPDGVKNSPESLAAWQSWPALKDNSALISITQVAFDGKWFYLTASKTDNGKKYSLGEDRMWVNGKEFFPVNSSDENGTYSVEADLSSLSLSSDFEVILPLSVYSKDGNTRYQNQEISFTVSYDSSQTEGYAWTLDSSMTFTHPDVVLTVTSLSVSATRVEATVHAEKTSETAEGYGPSLSILSPDDGKEAEFNDNELASWKGVQSGYHENEDGSEDWTLIYTGFTQIPEKLTFATRLVQHGEYVRNYPILYKDEVSKNG